MEPFEKKYLDKILKKFYLIINDLKKIFNKKRNKEKPIDIYEISSEIKKFFDEIYSNRKTFNNDKSLNAFGFDIKNNEYSKIKNTCLKSFVLSIILRIFVIEILKDSSLENNLINVSKNNLINVSNEIEKKFNYIYKKVIKDFPLDELLKEIYPLFLYSYKIVKENKIIGITKWEKPDFIIETENSFNFYEFTVINEKDNIENIAKKLSEKITKMGDIYKKNIDNFMISKSKISNFRIVVWDFYYKVTKIEVINIRNKIIKYLESKKSRNESLLKILKNDKDDTIEFKYFNIEKIS